MQARTEIGRLLHEEQRCETGIVERLERFLEGSTDAQVASTAAPDVRRLLNDLRSLTDQLPSHFAFEERAIFPILDAGGAKSLTALLRQDHDVLRLLARRLRSLCNCAIRAGFDAETWILFRAFARDMAQILALHLQTEETKLVRALDSALNSERDHALAASYRLTIERADATQALARPSIGP
jgi:hemerythrin-like domain-containing protein